MCVMCASYYQIPKYARSGALRAMVDGLNQEAMNKYSVAVGSLLKFLKSVLAAEEAEKAKREAEESAKRAEEEEDEDEDGDDDDEG